ncbi:hypothetical protein [Flavobacterium sp.]|uniref:hypothetical protein n=1 Tax=Flavobacterium sp. TaxID=239 RepID=UPI00391A9F91
MFYPNELIKPQKKSALFHILREFNTETVRTEINKIIKECRQCSLKEAGDVKTLKPTEVKLVLEKFS